MKDPNQTRWRTSNYIPQTTHSWEMMPECIFWHCLEKRLQDLSGKLNQLDDQRTCATCTEQSQQHYYTRQSTTVCKLLFMLYFDQYDIESSFQLSDVLFLEQRYFLISTVKMLLFKSTLGNCLSESSANGIVKRDPSAISPITSANKQIQRREEKHGNIIYWLLKIQTRNYIVTSQKTKQRTSLYERDCSRVWRQ